MTLNRRQFAGGLVGTGAVLGLAACSRMGAGPAPLVSGVTAASTRTTGTGQVRSFSLRARAVTVDLGGEAVDTWAYGDSVPGVALRATAGDRVLVDFTNDLPMATSVHWHGLAIRNDMDGVPGVTTPETPPGGSFAFDFVVPDAGTHWFHPHHGLQLDRGLYAPFIVDDPNEPGSYDAEWIVVLDDWTDGVGLSPERILSDLRAAGGAGADGGMGGMMGDHGGMGDHSGMGGMTGMGGMDGGDVAYPHYLVNGRVSSDPQTLAARPGDRVRLRMINAAADTIFTVALDGHDLTVTHSDGFPVVPIATSSVRMGMGERYDATVTLGDGVFALVAQPVGKSGLARALVRTGTGAVPPAGRRPAAFDEPPLTVDRLRSAPEAVLPMVDPETEQDILLSGSMAPYVWTINGTTYADTVPLTIRYGDAGRLRIRNMSMMSHPVHLHGHTFQIGAAGGGGARKDTVLVPPMRGISVDMVADNPGSWMVHCHNAYHAEAGMMTRLDYAA